MGFGNIVNGERSGHRVTSAEIWVNGVEVAAPDALGGNRRIVKVPIGVKASNTIHVVLRGPRDTWLTISVCPAAPK